MTHKSTHKGKPKNPGKSRDARGRTKNRDKDEHGRPVGLSPPKEPVAKMKKGAGHRSQRKIPVTWTPARAPRMGPFLNLVLRSWEGTPTNDGVAIKGIRANCATFVWALLVELFKMRNVPEFTFQMRSVFHDGELGLAAMQRFTDTFPIEELESEDVQPGDIVVAGLRHGGPSHLMIVGTVENTVWHCTHVGVRQGGWVLPESTRLQKIFRPDISRWPI